MRAIQYCDDIIELIHTLVFLVKPGANNGISMKLLETLRMLLKC